MATPTLVPATFEDGSEAIPTFEEIDLVTLLEGIVVALCEAADSSPDRRVEALMVKAADMLGLGVEYLNHSVPSEKLTVFTEDFTGGRSQ